MELALAVADGTEMAAYLALPADAPRGGLLVFQEAFGVNDHIRDIARRLAADGYMALAPELFHRTAPVGYQGRYDDMAGAMVHLKKLTGAGLEADIRAAYQWMADQPALRREQIGAVGFCMGGRAAYLAATMLPLAAAVSYYGGGIAPALLDRAPAVQCPLLLYWGGLDRHISAEQRRATSEALTTAGKDYVEVVFSRADHGFNCNERSSFHAAAARQAWALTLAFCGDHLR